MDKRSELIDCRFCGHQISKTTHNCPSCGGARFKFMMEPLREYLINLAAWVFIAWLIFKSGWVG